MKPEKLIPGGRVDILQSGEGMEITVRPHRDIGVIIVLPLCLLVWAAGEVFVFILLIREIINPLYDFKYFFAFLLLFWTSLGYSGFMLFLRTAFGSDVIKISPFGISINKRIGKWGKPKVYKSSSITNFRMLENVDTIYTNRYGKYEEIIDATPAFDYEGKTIEFSRGLKRKEVESLLDSIWNCGHLTRDNFAQSVIRIKGGEETQWDNQENWENWENWEDIKSRESEAIESATKSIERINADKEALAQDESLGRND